MFVVASGPVAPGKPLGPLSTEFDDGDAAEVADPAPVRVPLVFEIAGAVCVVVAPLPLLTLCSVMPGPSM